ncbi:MAG TPA: hypothetical protein VKO41_05350 [Gaiellaceae bacterium]|nr:hypothetical protein [Gaiellaceae bacterium]
MKRFVQERQFADDRREVLSAVESPVQTAHLRRQAVKPFQERVELTVADILGPIHRPGC